MHVEWHVTAQHKSLPNHSMGYIATEREPTERDIKEWREWNSLDDSWEVEVCRVESSDPPVES